jgi:DNA polymerase-1
MVFFIPYRKLIHGGWEDMNLEKLMLVDGNSILNRAFYGLRGGQLLATSDGLYTNAVYGFINILNKYVEEENPQYLCVAFDLKEPTFRHKEFDGYKANRKGMPEELAVQLPVAKEVLDAMNVKTIEYSGYEADDIIGTLSLCAEEKGMEVVILTGDRDSLQLAGKTTRIKIPVTRSGKTETEEYDYNRVVEQYGITPEQYIDVKGLMGDQSDNIPGVPGIGEKTALKLIRKFKSIENIYENLYEVDKKSVREKLEANKDIAFLSKKIARIERHMPYMCDIEDLERRQFNEDKLYRLFKRLEFNTLIEKFNLKGSSCTKASSCDAACIREPEELESVKELILSKKELSLFHLLDKINNRDVNPAGLALSCAAGETFYIVLKDRSMEEAFLKSFRDIFENESIKKYGHDMKNFIVYLKTKGIRLRGLGFDTMIAAYIINPSRDNYTVSQLSEEYLKKSIQSLEEMSGKGKNRVYYADLPLEKISSAAGAYSEAIFELRTGMDKIITRNSQRELYYDIELPLVEILADMEYHGFKVDADGLKSFSAELEGRINSLTAEIYETAGEEFNINSPKQLGNILFKKLNLPVIKKTKTGYSTDAEVLEQLEPQHEIISKILEYRQLVKLKSTYVEGLLSLINPYTGRVHSSFNQTITATGRISSTEPNLQNIPIKLEMGRKIRKVFVPENENFILLDADYSQIELRVLAHITGDKNLISAFKNNEDIHTTTASRLFGLPKEEVTPLMRYRAKTINFSIIYGIGEFSLSKDLGVTRKEASRYIKEYLDNYPGVRGYMQRIVEQAREKGFVVTLFNRRRYLPEIRSKNFNIRSFGERIAMNTPIQGSAADIIKIAMVKVHKKLLSEKLKSRLILQVHDELIIETSVDEKERVSQILKESMEKAVELIVPLVVEVKTGRNWYETM